jgi:hypothetical protein
LTSINALFEQYQRLELVFIELEMVVNTSLKLWPQLSVLVTSALLICSVNATDIESRIETPNDLINAFSAEVELRLLPPPTEVQRYSEMLIESLSHHDLQIPNPHIVVMIDRNPKVQVLFIFLAEIGTSPLLIGATAVSTGRIGMFDHFETPTGVFDHSISNLDFRAEGTKNELGIRGYGIKGMRVYDFGWQQARKGWGDRRAATMRLQMHATDPARLEQKLGTVQSKGCIRISASTNRLIDQYGLLDADYEGAMLRGKSFWVLHPTRTPTPWSGRYLIVVDTQRDVRPVWTHGTPFIQHVSQTQ